MLRLLPPWVMYLYSSGSCNSFLFSNDSLVLTHWWVCTSQLGLSNEIIWTKYVAPISSGLLVLIKGSYMSLKCRERRQNYSLSQIYSAEWIPCGLMISQLAPVRLLIAYYSMTGSYTLWGDLLWKLFRQISNCTIVQASKL